MSLFYISFTKTAQEQALQPTIQKQNKINTSFPQHQSKHNSLAHVLSTVAKQWTSLTITSAG